MHEEDQLRKQLVERDVPWLFDGERLRHFRHDDETWTFLNLDPTGGFTSGPDLVFHNGRDTLVVVELKVARARQSKPQMLRQLFAYGLQARDLLRNPARRVGYRSRRSRGPTFTGLCAESEPSLDPADFEQIVLVAGTMLPCKSKHVSKEIGKYMEKNLSDSDFDIVLGTVRPKDAAWRREVLQRDDRTTKATDFRWAFVEDIDTGICQEVLPVTAMGERG